MLTQAERREYQKVRKATLAAVMRYGAGSGDYQRAKHALREARTRVAFKQAEAEGRVRLRFESDDSGWTWDDLFGDTFNSKANPDIPPARMERERKAAMERVEREGVWGIIGEYHDGETWQHGGSVWMVDGDPEESECVPDIMSETLTALAKVAKCPHCGRPQREG